MTDTARLAARLPRLEEDELRDVRRAHRPFPLDRVILWGVTLVLAGGFAYIVAINPNFEWPVVAQYFFDPTVMQGLTVTLGLTVVGMAIGLGVVGTMMRLGIHTHGEQFFTVGMLLVFIVGFAMSAGPLIWTLCSEIQPLKGRDFGIGCSTFTNWVANWLVGLSFLPLLNSIGQAETFWLYAAFNVVFIGLTIWLVPETKGVTLEQIERNLMAGKPLREIGQ